MNPHKPPAIFTADSLGLDFLNTLATPVDEQVDWIDCDDGLLAWLDQARLVPVEALLALRAHALPGELDGVAARARKLREWFRAFVLARRGKKLGADDLRELEPMNRLLERDEQFDQVVADARGETSVLELRPMRRWRSPESLLLPIAKELAKVICE